MKKLLSVFVFVFAVAAVAMAQNAPAAQKETVSGPAIKFEKYTLDYGTVEFNADPFRTFKFTNVGTEPLIFAALWWWGDPERRFSASGLVFLALWQLHYVHRAFIYPFRLRPGRPNMPLSIAAMGATFNLFNAYINARWLYTLGPAREASWLLDPRFLLGLALFAAGRWTFRRLSPHFEDFV